MFRAVLCGAMVFRAVLCGAVIFRAVPCGAVLCGAEHPVVTDSQRLDQF